MQAVLTSVYCHWNVVIHCSQAKAGLYQSVAFVREPDAVATALADDPADTATLLETPGNFYPSALLSNAAALASAWRFIEAAGGRRNLQ